MLMALEGLSDLINLNRTESQQVTLRSDNDDDPLEPTPPPPPPGCDTLYLWISVAVIALAAISVTWILIKFCKRKGEQRTSLLPLTNVDLELVRQTVAPAKTSKGARVPDRY